MERYIAIIADIKDSKSIKDRESVQEKVGKTLKRVNEKYEAVIASNFTISSGDVTVKDFSYICFVPAFSCN